MPAPIVLGVDAKGFRELARDVRRANKGLASNLRKRLKSALQPVLAQAQANASWSAKIPASIKLSVTAKGAKLRAGGASAPAGAPFEGTPGKGTFRHPVFGNRQVWVEQRTRPYLLPALQANLDRIADVAAQTIDDWAADANFK